MNPANFWDDFDTQNKISSEGDSQGRYGYKIVHFKKKNGTYNPSQILSYAKENGWKLHDTINYDSKKIISWKNGLNLLFKPNIKGFTPKELEGGFEKVFPRYIGNDFTVYEFNTDSMILVNSITGVDSTQRTGFVLINDNKNMITVYHLWGETYLHQGNN